MKWKNKGHEFDFVKEISRFKKMFIFGAGINGKKMYDISKNSIEILGFIDNDPLKQGSTYLGVKVYSFEEFQSVKSDDIMVIITVFDRNEVLNIIKQMENNGFKYEQNLFDIKNFLPVYMWYKEQKLITVRCTMSVTDYCNLNCKYCSSFTPYLKNPKHTNLAELKNNIDCFFKAFDYIIGFNLIGGEPLLYPELDKIINYICDNYENQLGELKIITNGTIKPSDNLLGTMKKYESVIKVYISNYSHFLPHLKDSVSKFVDCMIKNKINYLIPVPDKWWVDYGRESVRRDNTSEEKLIDIFDNCNIWCRLLKNGKYYYCEHDGLALNAGFVDNDSGFDLKCFDKKDKPLLLEYSLGYSDKGYVDLCKKCNGFPPINKNYIPAAEQVEETRG